MSEITTVGLKTIASPAFVGTSAYFDLVAKLRGMGKKQLPHPSHRFRRNLQKPFGDLGCLRVAADALRQVGDAMARPRLVLAAARGAFRLEPFR